MHEPEAYLGIMVSSTFTDLKNHRQKVIEAVRSFNYKPNVMEDDGARADADVVDVSLKLVRSSAAYVGIISLKYGQTPFDPQRNPDRLSITELEFNEAIRLGRPILLFIMGESHQITKADIERDPEKEKKLDAFRERAKRMHADSEIERVYTVFESTEEFARKVTAAIGRLADYLKSANYLKSNNKIADSGPTFRIGATSPRAPALVALPRYLGSHPFVGRLSELRSITGWSDPADPNPMLLFEAMGGSGKSMLTWEWLTNHATASRSDWAGRFWYSFYEKGAVMVDFCREALAYMTEGVARDFENLHTHELSDLLVAELENRPWLFVLDGLERVLVAYHLHDAAQLLDEQADNASDQIGERNARSSIRPEDDELLRRLAAVAPSKIIVSSRLTPKALLNSSGVPMPGVRREILPGLRPSDAEDMIRACGVRGDSKSIQSFLKINCDCHPLVVGALAGLINNYPYDRGDFDKWENDARHGASLNLANIDLVQRRNHILFAAIDALVPGSRQLLQTLALLQGGADFETLAAFNPHLGTGNDPGALTGTDKLWGTIRDLEERGLLQYEPGGKRYDLHPVVRGVTKGRMGGDETQRFGGKVVNHFIGRPHDPWRHAKTLEDVAQGFQVVQVLISMERYDEALENYRGDLSLAMLFNLGAQSEVQALLKCFFANGWDRETVPLEAPDVSFVLNEAGVALNSSFPEQAWKLLERSLTFELKQSDGSRTATVLKNLAWISWSSNRLAEAVRLRSLALKIGEYIDEEEVFLGKLSLFAASVEYGERRTTDKLWRDLGRERGWTRFNYRPADAEKYFVRHLFYCGELTEDILRQSEDLAENGRNRGAIQELHELRGAWLLMRGEPGRAVNSLAQAVRMEREVGRENMYCEALLAVARLRAGIHFDAHMEAERLSKATNCAAPVVVDLWSALGERDRASEHAQIAYRWVVADGEPYVHRYHLLYLRGLMTKLGLTPPELPRFDPSKVVRYQWEDAVLSFTEKISRTRRR